VINVPKAKTFEEIKKQANSLGYELVEVFKKENNKKKFVILKCSEGHEFEKRMDELYNKNNKLNCPYCVGSKLSFEKLIEKMKDNDKEIVEPPKEINAKAKIKVRCSCGNVHYTTYDNVRKGCEECRNDNAKLTMGQAKEIASRYGYTIIEKEYTNLTTPMKMICPHGHKCTIPLKNFYDKKGCPKCRKSKGEKEIERYLKEHNIEFEDEHTFENCRYKNKLEFDFYIPSLNMCIEYDGEQHFRPSAFSGDEEEAQAKFEEDKKRDAIKNKFCKDNNINLVRIPYWELKNIDSILDKLFN
jgi:Zn finger protein HypA/HybF involved in hydrogenase expression